MANTDAIFSSVDRNGSGTITAEELQGALSNGLGTAFNINACSMMVKMFDADRSGTISRQEFSQLFGYVQAWQNCFRSYDRDNSGMISSDELGTALRSFGYNLSPQFISSLVKQFDRRRCMQIGFDDFIYICASIQILTNAFRPLDRSGTGSAQMSFEQFLFAAFTVLN